MTFLLCGELIYMSFKRLSKEKVTKNNTDITMPLMQTLFHGVDMHTLCCAHKRNPDDKRNPDYKHNPKIDDKPIPLHKLRFFTCFAVSYAKL